MTLPSPLPRVIQGGMGVAVSDWRLANAVARTGQLGVVSGSMLDTVFVADTESRRCVCNLCNGLTANIGEAQWRIETNEEEIPLVTNGDDLLSLASFAADNLGFTAQHVVRYLCS
jgi:NAD(P)H-dependent flavin oxidoreductase YrpB (nitropropane dioxygenase family)